MSAYNFINEYFPGWDVCGFLRNGTNKGRVLIRNKRTVLAVHVDMNGATLWNDSDVTPSHVEVHK